MSAAVLSLDELQAALGDLDVGNLDEIDFAGLKLPEGLLTEIDVAFLGRCFSTGCWDDLPDARVGDPASVEAAAAAQVIIQAILYPEERTHTPSKSCFYTATCEIGDATYTARSRDGAIHELARVLVAAGIPDAPLEVHQAGLHGHLTHCSFYAAAGWICVETATKPLHRARCEDPAVKRARFAAAFGERQGKPIPAG
jgi:hypothetical protein